jgi:hypothetical protein
MGGRLVIRNRDEWSGDYTGTGIAAISVDVIHLSGPDLELRLGINDDGPGWTFSSTDGVSLPAGGGWQTITFSLLPADLSAVGAATDLDQTLSNVTELRLFHSTFPAFGEHAVPHRPDGSHVVPPFGISPPLVAAQIGVDNISAIAIRPGDFDINGDINAVDIDLLSLEVRGGSNDATFDLTGDGLVNQEDRNAWVENVFGTFFGDADLNKTVEFADFLSLTNGFDMPGGWANGDFDGNGTVLFPDFLLLSSNFGKSATAVAAVPEPNAAMLLLVGLLGLVRRRRIVSETRGA